MKKLNFGCGFDLKKGYENVDIQKNKLIDKSFDFDIFPYPYEDNTFDYVWCKSVFAYVTNPKKVLLELRRICKPNAKIEIYCAYWNNIGTYNVLVSKRGFNKQCFKHLESTDYEYNGMDDFKILKLEELPTKFGRIIPRVFREQLSKFICGITATVHVVLEVNK